MSIDQARQDDGAAAVDHLNVGSRGNLRADARTDGCDPVPFDQDIGVVITRVGCVTRDDTAILDHDTHWRWRLPG
jgi:hypothetical protein